METTLQIAYEFRYLILLAVIVGAAISATLCRVSGVSRKKSTLLVGLAALALPIMGAIGALIFSVLMKQLVFVW